MTPEDARRRRRRRRDGAAAPRPGQDDASTPLPGPQAAPGAAAHPQPERRAEAAPRRRQGQSSRDSGERGLRDLVGAGRSQLGVSGALRGRDVDRPTEADLAEAEANLVMVRRHWTPPDKTPPDNTTGSDAR